MSFGDTFKALSDPTRREILNLLKRRSMTAGQIVEHFDTTGAPKCRQNYTMGIKLPWTLADEDNFMMPW